MAGGQKQSRSPASRNRVRHGILPRLERNLNPAVYETLSETAEIARAEEEYWSSKLENFSLAWQTFGNPKTPGGSPHSSSNLRLASRDATASRPWCSRVTGLRLEFREVEEILETACLPQGYSDSQLHKSMLLPNGWKVVRKKGELYFEHQSGTTEPTDYEYRLPYQDPSNSLSWDRDLRAS